MSALVVGAGQRVGRYSIIKAVGRGPNFETFQARAFGVEGFERDVALKIALDPALVESAEFREALARALELSHAGVLQLVDSDTESFDGTTRLYFVTELARGESLAQRLPDWRGTTEGRSRILRATSEVARVLDYAHRRRKGPVAHGQLHAGQIFVGARGEVKVADFAVARAVQAQGAAAPADDLASLAALLETAFEGASSPPLEQLIEAMRSGAMTAQGVSETLLELAVLHPEPVAPVTVPIDLALLSPAPPDASELAQEALGEAAAAAAPSNSEVRRRVSPAGRFVGRSEELAALGAFVAQVHHAGARWLRLRGPDGIGKTRLLRELARRLPQDKVGVVFPPLTEELGPPLSLQAIDASLRCLLDLPKVGSFDVDGLTSSLRAMGLTLEEIGCLCALMGASFSCDEPAPSGAEALLSLVAALRGGRPIVIAFENGARMDQASRNLLLDALASERARTVPLALFSIERGALVGGDHCEDFLLEELSDDDLAQLISTRLGARVIEPELFEAVSESVGGHPLYAEEYLRFLCEEALVDVKGGVASLVQGAPPPTRTVVDLVTAAHNQLPTELREVVKILEARVGIADPATVAAALCIEEADAELRLRELGRGGFLRFDVGQRAHLALIHRGIGESAPLEIHGRLAAHFARVGAFADAAQHHAASGDHVAAAEAWDAAAQGLWAQGLVEAGTDALSRALLHPRTAEQAVRRLTQLVEWLPRVAGLPETAEEGIACALAMIDDQDRARGLRLALVGPLLELGAYEAALVLNDQAASDSAEGISTAVARNRVAIAVLAGNPRLAPDVPAEFEQNSPKHSLDVAEWALLRGELALCATALEPLGASFEPAVSGASSVLRARYLRVLLNLAYCSESLAPNDPRLDELMAVTQSIRPHREAAESFLFVGRVLKNAAVVAKDRARANSIFNQASRFADEAHNHRCRVLALAESALLTKREAAVSATLTLASQHQAGGDAFLSLRLRLAVVELTEEPSALRRFILDARSNDLAGLATRLEAHVHPNRGD